MMINKSVRCLTNSSYFFKPAYHRFLHFEKRCSYVRLFKENDTMDFHYVWLRHNCPDVGKSIHPKTGERIVDCAEISLDIQPEQIELVDNKQKLKIVWSKDHTSLYDVSFLLANSYGKNRNAYPKPHVQIKDIEVIYDQNQHEAYLKQCYDRLKNFGLVVVRQRGLDTEAVMYVDIQRREREREIIIHFIEKIFFHAVHRSLKHILVELKIYVRIIQRIKIMIN